MGVANLQNFRSESTPLNLGDGISVRPRSYEELGFILHWDERMLDLTLGDDWERGLM